MRRMSLQNRCTYLPKRVHLMTLTGAPVFYIHIGKYSYLLEIVKKNYLNNSHQSPAPTSRAYSTTSVIVLALISDSGILPTTRRTFSLRSSIFSSILFYSPNSNWFLTN